MSNEVRQSKSQAFYLFILIFINAIALFMIVSNHLKGATQHGHLYNSMVAQEQTVYAKLLKQKLKCVDFGLSFVRLQHGNYLLLRNVFRGYVSNKVGCADTITFTTHGDYTFLQQLPALVNRWRGPVSLALFAPGADFYNTMNAIYFVRNCLPESDLIQKYVSFHVFFPRNHLPKDSIPIDEAEVLSWYYYDCSAEPLYLNVDRETMYKTMANLTYPINVGRNIARQAANTHFVFACDIDLMPSKDLAQNFLQMMAQNESLIPTKNNPRVFVLPSFELQANATLPDSKEALKALLESKMAVPFHKDVCPDCHLVPNQNDWLELNETGNFSITAIEKRQGKLKFWEPFYISNNREPVFDERVTYEGESSKRIQNYAMCLLGYDYYVLHPPFLVHRPVIKKLDKEPLYTKFVWVTNTVIKKVIEPEYRILYGDNPNCQT